MSKLIVPDHIAAEREREQRFAARMGALRDLIYLSLLVLAVLAWLTGCGMGAEFENPTIVHCTNGRTFDLREWKPYVGVGGPGFMVNKRTGETITDDGITKCYPVSDPPPGEEGSL